MRSPEQTPSKARNVPPLLKYAPVGTYVTIEKIEHGGSLQARLLSTDAVQFYWRYSQGERTFREPIGACDPTSPPKKLEPSARGFSVAAARERCRELAREHASHSEEGGLRGARTLTREAKLRAAEERRLAAAQAATEAEERARHTLAALLDDYVALQTSKGRITVREADSVFQRHVVAAWPEIAQAPAADLTQDQVVDMLRLVVEQSKGRTSNKLRTYLRAAYQCAVDVWVTAAIPLSFKKYNVRNNPVANTRRDASLDRADKHPLTNDELRVYWRLIEKLPDLAGRCLRLHLLTGGQRIEQLVRLRWSDVRADQITIYDIKGRPGQGGPRTHTLPLVDAAARDLAAFQRTGEYVFSTTEGVRPIAGTTLSNWSRQVVGSAIEGFQLKRVRSGVKTLFAANRVNREIRGHVQSHGLTGVQARHYDGHDYMREKREALEVLRREVTHRATPAPAPAPEGRRFRVPRARPVRPR